MLSPLARWALILVGVSFVVFMVLKVWAPLRLSSRKTRPARLRIQQAKLRATQAQDPATKAEAWREAAVLALEELGDPSLASGYARRAERADPHDIEALDLLARSLRRASRLGALERFLWRRLAAGVDIQGQAYDRAFDELVALYDGPMHRKERAQALRQLRGTRLTA